MPITLTLEKFLKDLGSLKNFQQHVVVDTKNAAVEVWLEDCSYHADWIAGEGADIAIFRANQDDRVIGVRLPLRNWNGKLPVDVL